MAYENRQHVTDEQRRDFLKALGVGGAVATGATLADVRHAVSGESATEELAPVGQAIRSNLGGQLDSGVIRSRETELVGALEALPALAESGVGEEPGDDFARIAAAGRPLYDHFAEVGFFEATSDNLPAFTYDYLTESVSAFVGSEVTAEPLSKVGLTEQEAVDLVASVVTDADQLRHNHWVVSPDISREDVEDAAALPPLTKGAMGGAMLWLEDLDAKLWRWQTMLTDGALADAEWHARSMAAGFQLVNEGAKAIADESAALSDGELGAILSTGFAMQALAQSLLPQDVYWITEEMRDERRTDLEMVTTEF
ncbi:twin-arginine translocation signal domain-containing protein [Halorussus litoreus]|uniref:twin-arginine translocation signal domain-containing protein n=1 Tax=Halorussus litoreus TaxID=1710536 RepID=UPI000E23532F|nr:twin-arginine translocation signal domain-containing protein [Halorussus litoreus]